MKRQLHKPNRKAGKLLTLLLLCFCAFTGLQAQTTGTVFRDYNGNAIKGTTAPNIEPGVSGIIVNAYNSSNTLIASYTTNSTGVYSIPLTGTAYNGTQGSNTGFIGSGVAVRLEFIIPASNTCGSSAYDYSSFNAAQNNTSVQFVTGGSSNINFPINNPGDYTTTTNPFVFVPQYWAGDPLISGASQNAAWFNGFPYNNTGTTAPTKTLNGATIGSVWGAAYSKQSGKVFTAAFLKRNAGLGTLGSGGIYILTPTATSFAAASFYNMDANGHRTRAASGTYGSGSSYNLVGSTQLTFIGTTDALTGQPNGLGVIGTNSQRGLVADYATPNNDPAAFNQIGKVGLGDIEISDDGKYLYVMNLYSRYLFRLTLNSATNPTAVSAVDSFALPTVSVTNGVLRPFGLKFKNNSVYVGAVASGENGSSNILGGTTDMYAYVFELQNATATPSYNITPTIKFPLNYTKGLSWDAVTATNRWYPWSSTTNLPIQHPTLPAQNMTYPTPILSGIEFGDNGALVMEFSDRSGHQYGHFNYRDLSGTTLISIIGGGDILAAGKNCSTNTYALEANGSISSNGITYSSTGVGNGEGPSTINGTSTGYTGTSGEFFNYDDLSGIGGLSANGNLQGHREVNMGSVTSLRGDDKVLTTAMDPTGVNTGGTMKYSTTNAAASSQYQIYLAANDHGDGSFRKGIGLGDVELAGDIPSVEIGNRVWKDINGDGIQEAGEPVLVGVTVALYDAANTLIATAVTNANGNYLFSSATGTSTTSFKYGLTLVDGVNYTLKVTALGANASVTGLSLTDITIAPGETNGVANTGATLSNNDAFLVASIPTISIVMGGIGENNHTYDFGFVPCTKPNAGADQTVACYTTGTATMAATGTGTWTAQAGNPGTATITTPTSATTTITGFSVAGTYNFIFTNSSCSDTAAVVVGSNCVIACTGNLLQGSSFETSTDLTYWTATTTEPGGSLLYSVANGYEACGSQYGYIRASDNGHNPAYLVTLYQNVAATAGTTYNLSVYAGTHDPVQDQQIRLEFYDASNTLLGGGQTVQVDTDVDVAPFTLGLYNLSGVAPAGTAFVRVTASTQGIFVAENTAFKFDCFCLTAVACTKPNAGTDQSACLDATGTATATLTGTATTAGTWSALAGNPGGASLGSTTGGVATATFGAAGTFNFVYTVGTCTDTMQVVAKAPTTSSTPVSVCSTALPYVWNGNSYNAAGSYTVHLTNSVGCDSAATLVLTVNTAVNAGTDGATAICSNSTASIDLITLLLGNQTGGSWTRLTGTGGTLVGSVFTPAAGVTSSTFRYIIVGSGCPNDTSFVTITVKATTTSSTSVSVCSTALPYLWNGINRNAAGTYTYTTTNAAGCDSTATLILTVKATSTSSTSVSVCSTALPYLWNGINRNAAGTYTYTTTNAAGCDSTATLILTVKATSTSSTSVSICSTALPYLWNGINRNAAGTYTYTTTNAVGCDSTATLVLTVKATSTSSTNTTICSTQLPYIWNGLTFNAAGSQTYHTTNSVGCDSAATLNLTVTTAGSIGNYVWSDLNGNGSNDEPASAGINGVTVELWNATTNTLVATTTTANNVGNPGYYNFVICTSGDYKVKFPTTVAGNGLTTPTTTAATDNNSDANTSTGFSPTFTINLSGTGTQVNNPTIDAGYVPAPSSSITNMSVCPIAMPVTWNGNTYNAPGTYTVHLTNSLGGDSAATLVLTLKPNTTSTTTASVCSTAMPYTWNGNTYNAAGSYTVHLTNSVGCDSAATLVLTVKPNTTSTTNASVCSTAMPYTWNGNTYNAAGSYTVHLTNSVGCDSAATLVLTVKPTSTSSTPVSVCSTALPYTWNGNTYNAAGSYTVHLTNSLGCDSAATLVLTVKATSASTTNTTIASLALPYTWNGNTYNAAGTYIVHLTNSVGCDSAATLVLTVIMQSSSTTNMSVCPIVMPYTWNGNTYNTAGTYTVHLTNSNGGDSAATLVLTVKANTTSITNMSVCPTAMPVIWNGNTYNAAGSYTVHLTNSVGCDSAATLVLTVNPIPPVPTCNPVTVCNGVSAMTAVMSVVSPAAGTIVWNTGNSSTATTYTYTVSNACGSASCTNAITRTAAPAAPTCAAVTLCAGVDATSAVMAVVTPLAGGMITWNTGNATTATYYTYTVSNSCGSLNCSNQIIRTPAPSSITCNPVSVCSGVDATSTVMSSVSISGGSIVWNTGNATTATSYTYTITNACGSASCSNTITRLSTPATPTCSPVTICSNSDATAMVNAAVSPSGGTITWLPNGSNATTATSYTYTVSNACGSASCTNSIARTAAGSIGNYVWEDTNRNGLQDEPANLGIIGAYVELYMDNGTGTYTLVATTHTANDGAGNPGYYNFPICTSGNYKVRFQTNYNGGNLTTQTTTPATDGNSDADEITGYTPVIVIDINGTGTAKNNNTIDAGYKPTSVTPGGGGGTESKTLGDVIAVRLFGNAINSKTETTAYTSNNVFTHSGVIVNGTNNLTLSDLVPRTVANTDAAYVSTPTDLVNFTNAVEVLAIDYAKGNTTKAVAFGTKTLGDIYSHTKPICDRLKGAELLDVKNINVNGYNLMAYQVRQRTGEIEYAMNLSAGTASNRNTISLQSNWFTNSYTADENLYNFQLWAVSYDMVKSMAADVISKLQANGSIYIPSATIADLPKAYISKGIRKTTDLTVTVQNNTSYTTGYFELKEKANELMDEAQITTRQVPFTVAANGQSIITIPVSDNYEGSIYVYLNNKLTDLVYLADGTWSIDYNKASTSIQQFNVVNEASINQTSNSNEHRLLRNVEVAATTKDYVSIYKTMMGGGIEQNVAAYNSLMFNANAIGASSVKITLIKKSITNWNDQYSYTATIGDGKDFAIALNSFKSSKFNTSINANDITAINFSFITARNTATNMTVNLSKVRFSTAAANALASETLNVMSVYPNPTMGRFSAVFTSDVAQPLVLKVTEVATGRIVDIEFINAVKGENKTKVTIDNSQAITSGLYIVSLEGDNIKYTPVKMMMNK